MVITNYLNSMKDLEKLDCWSKSMLEELIFKELRVDKNSLSLESVGSALNGLRMIESFNKDRLLQTAEFLL